MNLLFWENLSEKEKEQVKEIYLAIREVKEKRNRNETNFDYDKPIDWEYVKNCRFYRHNDGYIEVVI